MHVCTCCCCRAYTSCLVATRCLEEYDLLCHPTSTRAVACVIVTFQRHPRLCAYSFYAAFAACALPRDTLRAAQRLAPTIAAVYNRSGSVPYPWTEPD